MLMGSCLALGYKSFQEPMKKSRHSTIFHGLLILYTLANKWECSNEKAYASIAKFYSSQHIHFLTFINFFFLQGSDDTHAMYMYMYMCMHVSSQILYYFDFHSKIIKN